MNSLRLKIGTRGSQLALIQARWIQQRLKDLGIDTELAIIRTEGDVQAGPLKNMGGQGAFTRRIQQALLNRNVDLAVHSLKDLPTQPVAGLKLAAVPVREDHRDALVSNRFRDWRDLSPGSIIGTGSPRRTAAIKNLRPDLVVRDIRGNLDTRLKKLDQGNYDALVLACAGLERLEWGHRIASRFSVREMPPAAGQGALGLECREDDSNSLFAVAELNDPATRAQVDAERAVLRTLKAGCLAPIGVATSLSQDSDELSVTATLFSEDGTQRSDRTVTGPIQQAEQLGAAVAEQLLQTGLSFPRI